MRSNPEQRRSAWKRRAALFSVLLAPLAFSVLGRGPAGHVTQVGKDREVHAAAIARDSSAPARGEAKPCPTGEVPVAPADIGVGDSVRCLPVGGDEVQGSRVDPLYGQVADALVERMSGQTAGVIGSVKVICWSEQDRRALSVAFSNIGLESVKFRRAWAPKERGVINLSHLVCRELDRIAYQDAGRASLATGAAVGTLAHEAMHVARIDDEGVADCYATQLTAVTALGLGAGRAHADLLQLEYLDFNRQFKSGTEYDSPDCYDGGPLDLDPESSRWP